MARQKGQGQKPKVPGTQKACRDAGQHSRELIKASDVRTAAHKHALCAQCRAASGRAGAPRYFGKSVAKELSSSMPVGLSSFLKGSIFQWSMPS